MPVFRLLSTVLLLGALAMPAYAADSSRRHCVSKAEQSAAVAANKAVPLAQVVKTLQHARRAEVVRARLCRNGDSLVYLLTLLGRSGKVTRVTVDAASGEFINGAAF